MKTKKVAIRGRRSITEQEIKDIIYYSILFDKRRFRSAARLNGLSKQQINSLLKDDIKSYLEPPIYQGIEKFVKGDLKKFFDFTKKCKLIKSK